MSSAVDSHPMVSAHAARARAGRPAAQLPFWAFLAVAGLLLAFLILLGLLVVVTTTYWAPEIVSPQRQLDRGWALLAALALAWAAINLYWAAQAAQALKPLAIYAHFAMTIGCGLIALGTHSVLFARAVGTEKIVMDYSSSGDSAAAAIPTVAAPAQGDAEEGRKIFSTTCITCHGPTGGGLPNLAPSLRGSPFIASADDAAVGNLIRNGRPVGDPNNKSGKVMPARGGNPFLGDDKIVHLVAFVRAIQSEGAGAPSGSADPNAPPPVQLAHWVLPAGPSPPADMISLDSRQDVGDAESITARNIERRQQLIRTLTLGLTGIHGLFLFGVMIASSNVLLRRLTNSTQQQDRTWWSLSSWGWIVALAAWLIVFVYGFVWLK